jgi:glycosyltransferase involved in cell wall biosynthesis
MEQKLISICIPTYNRPLELKRLLESIDTTKYDDVDIVISENCSPKQAETREVVEEYKKTHPYEVHYYENERNLGYDKNIRAAVARATGLFCVFFSDDDMAMPGALDEYIEFVRAHKDCGYILRSYRNYNEDETEWQDFRYYSTDREFPAGRDTAIELFDRSVFLSGFTIRQEYAKEYVTDAIDGSLLYQMYLLLQVCRRYPSAYSRILVSKAVPISGNVHYFGTGDGEEGYKDGETMTNENTINFFRWYVKFFNFVEDEFKDGTGTALLRQHSNSIYPTMASQLRSNPNKKAFKKFCMALFNAGLQKTTYCMIYYYSLLLFGVKFCDRVIATIKKILGRRPNL